MLRISLVVLMFILSTGISNAQQDLHPLRTLQFQAIELNEAPWAHWGGHKTSVFSTWTNHSNRLIPVFSYGVDLNEVRRKNSAYRSEDKLKQLYGQVPEGTLNPKALYFDQTDIYRLNHGAFKSGKKNIILMVFDGMDWQTIHAAASYRLKKNAYKNWRGKGLAFQDYKRDESMFGFCVTSPYCNGATTDVDTQVVKATHDRRGGYSPEFGGHFPWENPSDPSYLLAQRRTLQHAYTDSASSATSLNAGVKTYNGSINVGPDGRAITTLAHQMQQGRFRDRRCNKCTDQPRNSRCRLRT